MIKRFAAIILAAVLLLSVTACNRIENAVKDAIGDSGTTSRATNTPSGGNNGASTPGGGAGENLSSTGGSTTNDGNMSSFDDSRYRFWDVFDEVRDKVYAALDDPDNNVEESYYYSILLTSFSSMNLMFIPIYYIDNDEYFENGGKDGWTNIEREQKGNLRTVSFIKPDSSGTNAYTAEYDGTLDSLKITFTFNDFNMFWEYVRVGDSYVSQMYQGSPESERGVVYKVFFDEQNITFMNASDSPMPASIYQNKGLSSSFVQVPTTMFSTYISYMNGTLEITSN
ncbi:MAG: hypothetical protein FWG36_00690 [Oscillospiraceae bacterium]|nr:hypothetical protein [Oscillospiraceae bacterium]